MSNIETKRHSLAHILAMAVQKKHPEINLGIGPVIDNGFYYDLAWPAEASGEGSVFSLNNLVEFENAMNELIKQKISFTKKEISADEANKLFANQPFKLELIKELAEKGSQISIYESGDFTDLCAGPHIGNSSEITEGTFKLTKISGAYWKGDEKNAMLTRIYGVAFDTKEELEKYLKNLEEAEKRDHRKLGKELDLFHIDEKVGLGLPLWHPKGAMLWRQIEDFWYQEHIKNGYDLVRSPHIGNRILWETSGHWGFYNASMYPPIEVGQTLEAKQKGENAKESEEYLLKPMNCPFHVQIFKSNPRSYRDFPLRWAECGTVYRFEKKGELSGLTRVRGFTQDDAHIICRADQVENELKKVIDFILFIFKSFGFDIDLIDVFLSLRDPNNKEKYAGNDEGWNFTENVLRKIAKEKGLNVKEEEGEAAFYGPKLDFKLKDVLGRRWQCSTLQFDFNLPERFDMTFTNNKGESERPYMLHRALFGSYERFIALLIEHYAGAFPVWLAPVQTVIIPVSEKFDDYGNKVLASLREKNIRATIDNSNESLGKRIREAQAKKIPYILVVGEKEVTDGTVAVRDREGKQETLALVDFVKKICDEIAEKKK